VEAKKFKKLLIIFNVNVALKSEAKFIRKINCYRNKRGLIHFFFVIVRLIPCRQSTIISISIYESLESEREDERSLPKYKSCWFFFPSNSAKKTYKELSVIFLFLFSKRETYEILVF
jgi:hypothetical protein